MPLTAPGSLPHGSGPLPPIDAVAPAVELRDVWRSYGSTPALEGVSLEVADGEFFSLLGPSGCGKSTLLRLVAGLDLPDRGDILLHGGSALRLPAHRRPVNTVFQSYALFPHLDVEENVGFGLRVKGVEVAERARRVSEAMSLVRLGSEVAQRRPEQLSGGQRQRVALARALVNEPRVLLLDEPLAALDRQLRIELREELQRVHRRTGITFILVTHDQDEALSLSHRIAVMRGGRIEQRGSPRELYDQPINRFVAEFLGACNVWHGSWVGMEGSSGCVEVPLGRLKVGKAHGTAANGRGVEVGIRPEQVVLHPEGTAGTVAEANVLSGAVETVRFEGAACEVTVRIAHGLVRAYGVRASCAREWREGEKVRVELPMAHVLVWPGDRS